ncbi:hypothetical protein DXG01_007919 [Tephrocybe rancida]|nr:hypothetical protein DXG01_007919 [Tephrocybe rancida]
MVFSAENALQAHEAEQRYVENKVRKQARYDLTRRGIVATETEIAKWKRERIEDYDRHFADSSKLMQNVRDTV